MKAWARETLAFDLPDELVAHEPPEARGLSRDGVRLLVSRISDDVLEHARFRQLPDYLERGDLLVVNASATINAALPARHRGEAVLLHLSTPLASNLWIAELRRITATGNAPLLDAEPGESVQLPARAEARLLERFRDSRRLWMAQLSVPADVLEYTQQHGAPIRYGYVGDAWPLEYYQTVFAREPGSAEMPSAGRPFTEQVVTRLEQKGVRIAPVVLHAGVSSLDYDESPYPERYRVPQATADAINAAHAGQRRVIAVGTTVVRALETVSDRDGIVHAGAGWTDVVITRERGVYAADGLLTGLHGPRASHLWMLESFAGERHLSAAYAAAIEHGYHWHEFGDLHLIVP